MKKVLIKNLSKNTKNKANKYEFGGQLLYLKRKSQRPLMNTNSTHLVLRLKQNLPGLFEPHDYKLREQIYKKAAKYEIRIDALILNHSHMHGVFLFPDREKYVRFIRELTSFLVSYFTKQMSFLNVKLKNIFHHRPYTRIVFWGEGYKRIINYMKKNELESGCPQQNLNKKLKCLFFPARMKFKKYCRDQLEFCVSGVNIS